MKRVAMIYFHPLTAIDGATKVVKSFVDNDFLLKANGVSIDLFAPDHYSGIGSETVSNKGRGLLSIFKGIVFKFDFAGVLRMMYNLYIRSGGAVRLYRKRANQREYDVVFVHDLLTCYEYIKTKERKPLVLVMHTTGDLLSMTLTYYPLLKYTLFYNIVLKKALKTVLNKTDRIVFNSKLAADNFYKLYPNVRPGLATFVNNGVVDITEEELAKDHPVYPPYTFVCVGSISERKGQRFIVEALKQSSETVRNRIKFLFVGDGEIRKELEEECKQTGLSNSVVFCGLQKDVVPFLQQSNIFILPSVDEGMPISILEAMRQGLPVVSTRVGGIPYQVIDGKTGILIDASIEGVKHLLENIDDYDWKVMRKEARKRYEQEFGIEQMMTKYADILKGVC